MNTARILTALTLVLVVVGCGAGESSEAPGTRGGEEAAPPGEVSGVITPEIRDALERGNAAFRADEFEEALQHYQEALRMDSTVEASLFGLYIAHEALGNTEEAQAIREKLGTGAIMPHPMGGSEGGRMP
jgi:tetratricopeptide (TPR) repeat protein